MGNLFEDIAYDELDEISQLVEPYKFGVNDDLAQFPDEIELDASFFEGLLKTGYANRDIRKIVEQHCNNFGLSSLYNYIHKNYNGTSHFFKLEIEEGSTFDPATGELKGSIKVIKHKMAMEDKEIDELLINYMSKKFNNFPRPSQLKTGNINEICDLFGVKEALKERSARGKLRHLYSHYKEIFSDRRLNIRDVELFKRFIDWNYKYIVDGNLPAMSNITKVKIMMRSELPIYSIKEEEV